MPFGREGRKTAPMDIMAPKVYHPTMEEFSDFLGYINKIEREDRCYEAGIVKIVPPAEWIPRKCGYKLEDMNFTIEGPIKQRFKQVGMRGCYQTKGLIQQKVNVVEYEKIATSPKYATPNHEDDDDLERKYWKSLSFVAPVYGCDVSRAISDPELKVWNIAKLDSILKYVSEDLNTVIQGVNSPYLYFGMWKATFSWHVEDMDLYGINMVHWGAPKTWYCVPPKYGHLLEKACRALFPNVASWCSNFMRHKTCLVAPHILDKYGVPYQKVVQREREIIIVFPYAYHSGFNHGFNIAESTNFATERWIEYGKRQRPCDCDRSRVKFSMKEFVRRFQPDKFDDWMNNLDIAPHPEDPPDVVAEINLRAENPREWARRMEEDHKRAEEKRLKKFEQRKKTDKAALGTAAGSVVHVYRHVELSQIEVEVNPKTNKFHSGRQMLAEHLDNDNIEAADLIDKGILVKVGERQLANKKRAAEAAADGAQSQQAEQKEIIEKRVLEMYRHVSDDNINCCVDPETKDLVTEPSKQLLDYLKTVDETVKTLIETNVFVKVSDCVVEMKKVEKSAVVGPPPKKAKTIKDTDVKPEIKYESNVFNEKDGEGAKIGGHQVDIYRHGPTGEHLKISSVKRKLYGRKSERTLKILDGKTIDELIDEGLLVKVGTRTTRANGEESGGQLKKGVFKLSFGQQQGENVEIVSNGNRTVYSFGLDADLLSSLMSGHDIAASLDVAADSVFTLSPEVIEATMSNKFAVKKSDGEDKSVTGMLNVRKALLGSAYTGMSDSARLVKHAHSLEHNVVSFVYEKVARTFVIKLDGDNIDLSIFPEKQAVLVSEPSGDALPAVKADVDTDEVEESVKVGPKAEPIVEAKKVEKSDNESEGYSSGDNSEDELFTTDESSESNDESSDDPDYHGSRWDSTGWKSTSGTARKRKKLKKANARQSQRPRGKKRLKKTCEMIADESAALVDLTKRIMAMPFDVGHVFKLEELVETLGEDRGRIITVIRIFRGFRIVKKISDSDQSFTWKGVNDEEIDKVLIELLENSVTESKDALWNICCDVLRILLRSRRGSRVYLPLIALQYGVDEVRRISFAASVIIGMSLAYERSDETGGITWSGRDIYSGFHIAQYKAKRPEFGLRELVLRLEHVDVLDEHRYDYDIPTFKTVREKFAKFLSVDGASEEKRRSIQNRDIVCKCGIKAKPNSINAESHIIKKVVQRGFKKRVRCRECVRCLAPKCNNCNFCLNPRLKKPCVNKGCLYPKVPNCPCFS